MLSLFTKTSQDDLYGEFKYHSNNWVNTDSSILGYSPVRLVVPGNRFKISRDSISELLEFETDFESQKTHLAGILFNEHYLPCKTAIEQGILKTLVKAFPEIASVEEIWHHVKVLEVRVNSQNRAGEVQVALAADWDVEQTLGFTFRADDQIEFCQNLSLESAS